MNSQKFDPELFNVVNPIVAMKVYSHGNVEIERKSRLEGDLPRSKRGKIRVFSKVSRERLVLVAKETSVEFLSMITLTYGQNYPHSGSKVKGDLHKMLGRMRSSFGGFEYLWFFEFQKRGAPHIHIIVNIEPPAHEDRVHLARLWVDGVQQLDEWEYSRLKDGKLLRDRSAVLRNHIRRATWERIRERDGVSRYCAKYASKMRQKVAPQWFGNVGRFWGHSRNVGIMKYTRVKAHDEMVRRILKDNCPRLKDVGVIPRYVFDCFT